jgi:hypothetical protein
MIEAAPLDAASSDAKRRQRARRRSASKARRPAVVRAGTELTPVFRATSERRPSPAGRSLRTIHASVADSRADDCFAQMKRERFRAPARPGGCRRSES